MTDIRRLASHLGISIGTVSRALNNRAGVNPDTRARVLQAATELGYVANQSGRNLRRGSTNTIGFVIETGAPTNRAGDDFFFVVIDALNLYLAERGYDLVVLPCHSADDPVEFLARVVARGTVDALILTATRRQDRRIDLLARTKMPFLTLGRSESLGDYPWLDLDFEGVARRSVAELAAVGHGRIAVALPDSDATLGHHYLAGYRDGLAARGISYDPALVYRVETSEAGGFEIGRQVLAADPRPTAVLLCSESTTVGFYSSLSRAGVTPGPDLSVIAFRENPQLRFLTPAPACFRLSLTDLGLALGQMVLDLVSGQAGSGRDRHVIWPMDLVLGSSICPPADAATRPDLTTIARA